MVYVKIYLHSLAPEFFILITQEIFSSLVFPVNFMRFGVTPKDDIVPNCYFISLPVITFVFNCQERKEVEGIPIEDFSKVTLKVEFKLDEIFIQIWVDAEFHYFRKGKISLYRGPGEDSCTPVEGGESSHTDQGEERNRTESVL